MAHSITLNWAAAPKATAYFVYRGTKAGGEAGTPINGSPISGTTYTDTAGLVEGTTYFYFVTSFDGTNQSVPSLEVSATVPTSPLAPPTNITITVV